MIPICLFCHTEMVLEKKVSLKEAKKVSKRAKTTRRRFGCETCDYKTTIFADGSRDLEGEHQMCEEELNRINNLESEARN